MSSRTLQHTALIIALLLAAFSVQAGIPVGYKQFVIQYKASSVSSVDSNLSHSNQWEALSTLTSNVLNLNNLRASFKRPYGQNAVIVTVPTEDSAQFTNRLQSDPAVDWIAEDRPVYPADQGAVVGLLNSLPTSFSNRFWHHNRPSTQKAGLNTFGMWENTHGSSNVVVAVLDTGVIFNHPMLQGHLLSGYDFVSESFAGNDGQATGRTDRDADPSDPGDGTTLLDVVALQGCSLGTNSSWHGTFVSGLVAGNPQNNVGMLPTAWNVSVLPVRVLGRCGGLSTDLADGIRWAAGLSVSGVPANPTPAKVINLSLAAQGACVSSIEGQAIAQARAAGAVVIAAVGNDGSEVDSPANCPGVIGVAATDQEGFKANYSNFGPEVDLTAPGGDSAFPLWSSGNSGATGPGTNTYRAKIGSSFSTGLVSGVAGALFSVAPTASGVAVENALLSGTRPFLSGAGLPSCSVAGNNSACLCNAGTCGRGMLDASLAVNGLLGADRVNLFSNSGSTVPVGGTRLFEVDSSVTFSIENIQKSSSGAANPALAVSNQQAAVTMPSGVSGYTLVARSATSQAAVFVTPQVNTLTTPGVVTGVLDTLNIALVSTAGNPSGAPSSGSSTDSSGSAQGVDSSTGGGGGGSLSWAVIFLIFSIAYVNRRGLLSSVDRIQQR